MNAGSYDARSFNQRNVNLFHCVKSVQIRSFFWSVFSLNTEKYGPEKTLCLDTFHGVCGATKRR